MALSLYLARAWGLFALICCAGLLLNRRRYTQMMAALQGGGLMTLVAGVIALGLGAAQISGYESLTFDYRGLITLLGWIALLKGAAIIFVPGYLQRFAAVFVNQRLYSGALAVFVIVGAFLLYRGLAG